MKEISRSSSRLELTTFVLGAPRSGTTLLRVMLAGHDKLFVPPEMVLAPFETMAQRKAHMEQRFWEKGGLRRALIELEKCSVDEAKQVELEMATKTVPEAYAYLQSLLGDRILVDKCPHLSASPEALKRLQDWFRDTRFVWIVRHPGSVTRSLENMPYAELMLQRYAGDARDVWLKCNLVIGEFLAQLPEYRWCQIRYEDMVRDPQPSMETICNTIGIPFQQEMLNPYSGEKMREGPQGARAVGDPNMASRGKIQPELADKWLAGFDPETLNAETHKMAKTMGYDLENLPEPPIRQVTHGFNSLLDTVKNLEARIRLPMDLDALEGRRFLLRMLSASVDEFVENRDYERPHFVHTEGPTRKMFADCPDADYRKAALRLDQGYTYRISGCVPAGTTYCGIVLYRKGGLVGNSINDLDLQLDDKGQFELHIGLKSSEPGESDSGVTGPWLLGDGDETGVIVRQYFTDRRKQQPVELHIERQQATPGSPPSMSEVSFAHQLTKASQMVREIYQRTVETYQLSSLNIMNRFIEQPTDKLFPTPDNRYQACWYRIGWDQVMFIRGKLPQARYVGFCLYNAWLESLDYRNHQINLNHDQLHIADDGNFEICIAHKDIGHPNWLDTAGHNAGYVGMRTLLLESDMPRLETEIKYERELT